MTYVVSERANRETGIQILKITKQLKRKQKERLCVITNIINACLRILIIPYLLPIVYR